MEFALGTGEAVGYARVLHSNSSIAVSQLVRVAVLVVVDVNELFDVADLLLVDLQLQARSIAIPAGFLAVTDGRTISSSLLNLLNRVFHNNYYRYMQHTRTAKNNISTV